MFDYPSMVKDGMINGDQVWTSLDSFWRTYTSPATRQLLWYLTYATQIEFLNTYMRNQCFIDSHSVDTVKQYLKQPWYPLVITRDQIQDNTFVLYGDPYIYFDPPQILYGEAGDPAYRYQMVPPIAVIPELVDQLVNTTVVIDPSSFVYDSVERKITFAADPFTLVPVKTFTDGNEYIVLWIRNVEFDFNVMFDQIGWVLKYEGLSTVEYLKSLQFLQRVILQGPNLSWIKGGMSTAAGFPAAEAAEIVRDVQDDGYQLLISTDSRMYTCRNDVNNVVVPGQLLKLGDPLTDGIKFFEPTALYSISNSDLPALTISVPLSTGVVAKLTFENTTLAWDFDALRPSPWRFPVNGVAAEVEQFWIDVDTFATANGIDFATLFGLPAAVNPMQLVIQQLMGTNIFVATTDLSKVHTTPAGFTDRVRTLIPGALFFVLHQNLLGTSDTYDLGSETSESVTLGYNATPTADVVSVPGGGTDLVYYDQTPMVAVS